jgi:hypothetical protein
VTTKKKPTARDAEDAADAPTGEAAEMTYETVRVPPRAIAGYRRSVAELAGASTTQTETLPATES